MAAKNDSLVKDVKVMLRSVLLSSKGGVDENFLLKEYRELTGDPLPYRQLGFNSLYDMAREFTDVLRVSRQSDGSLKYLAIADASTAHIQKMVSAQKSNKRKPKKNQSFNVMRRPTRQSTWFVNRSSARPSVFSHSTSFPTKPGRRTPPPSRRSPPATRWATPQWKTSTAPQAKPFQQSAAPWPKSQDVVSFQVTAFNAGSSYNAVQRGKQNEHMNLQVTRSPNGTRYVNPPVNNPSEPQPPRSGDNLTNFRSDLPPRFQRSIRPQAQPSAYYKPTPSPLASPTPVTPVRPATQIIPVSQFTPTTQFAPATQFVPTTQFTPLSPVTTVTPSTPAMTYTPKTSGNSTPAAASPRGRPALTPLQDARKKTAESEDFPKLLGSYMQHHNLQEEFMTVPLGRGKKGKEEGFVSSISIHGQTYGSLGIFSTQERAEYFAAKTAWEGLNAHKVAESSNGSSSPVSAEEVKRNVALLLNEKPNGIFENMVPEEYRKKWNSVPPRNLMVLLEEWTDVASVEEVAGVGKKIVYPSSTLVFSHFILGEAPETPKKKEVATTETPRKEEMAKEKGDVEKRDHIPEAELPSVGSTVVSVICFVIDCESFFVHLVKQTAINDIMGKMEDLYVKKVKGEPPLFNQSKKLESMKYCAGLYDGQWYRAQALTDPVPNKFFEDEIEVCYIDFGNVETEQVSKLRPLSRSLYGYPPQAVQCSLYGVTKRSEDSWDTATLQLKILEEQGAQISMTIKGIKDDVCQVELYNDVQRGRSINEMLIKAKLVRDTLKVKAQDPGPLVVPDVPSGETLDVFVSHIYSASNIILRLLTYQEQLAELEKLIQDNNQPTGKDDLEQNDLCAAFDQESLDEDSEDNPWSRVRILEMLDKEKARVEYLDYGGTAEMELKNLRLLNPEENQLPYQSLHVRLTALEGCEVEEVTEKLKSLCELHPCLAEVNGRDPVSVTLWDTSTAEDVNINELILQILNQDELAPKVPQSMGDAECFVVHVSPSGTVFVHIKGPGMQTLQQLLKQAMETIAKTEDSLALNKVEPNLICLAFFSDQWYRARILEVCPDDRAKVFLVDYGMETEVGFNDLLDLDICSMKLSHLPHQAVEVRLDGTPSVWTEKALNALEQLVQDQTLFIETIAEGTQHSPPSVELHTFRDGDLCSVRETLMSDLSLWDGHDLNHLIETFHIEDDANSDVTNNNSLAKVPTPEEDIIANYVACSPGDGSTETPVAVDDTLEVQKLRDLPNSGDKIFITSAASPSNFQFIPEKDRTRLKYLMMDMQDSYSEKINKESDVENVELGDRVAAYNPEDGMMYRAIVKKLLPTDQLSVYLLDYGDHNVVARSHVYQLVTEFSEEPPFAMSATLIGISPATGTVWSTAATQRFDDLAFEKTLVVWAPQPVAWVGKQVALTLLMEANETQEENFVHKILLSEGLAKPSSRRNSLNNE